MDALTGLVDSQAVLVIAAITVLLLLVTLLVKILRANLGLILILIAIVLGLQYFFSIDPNQLWSQIGNLPQDVMQLVQSFNAG